jgi:imidazolonepropionase-like amidohydrolase
MSLLAAALVAAFTLAPGDVVVRHATVVSPERDAPLPGADVVIRGERIAWIGSLPADLPTGVAVVEASGRYLVPGLIDGHVHLAAIPGLDGPRRAAMPELAAAYFQQLPRSYLYFGFTTVVDLNVVDPAVLARVRAAALAPEVLDCGGAVTVPKGFPILERPLRYPNVLDGTADHSPEAIVARIADGGGACVKAFYEPGPPAAPFPLPTLATLQALRDAAHRRGLPLLLHANSLAAHRFAVELRPDAVAHGLWNWNGFAAAPELPAEVRAVLDAEIGQGLGYMPTLRVMSSVVDLFTPAFLDDPQLARVYPPGLLAYFRSPAGQWLADETNEEHWPAERMRALYRDGRTAAFTYMAGHRARLLFGSDTPSDATYANPPGYNGYLELREMERAGATPRQAMNAATLENARLFRIDARAGSVEVGKLASLLLLREDPLKSTAAWDTIETVLVRGRVIARGELLAR